MGNIVIDLTHSQLRIRPRRSSNAGPKHIHPEHVLDFGLRNMTRDTIDSSGLGVSPSGDMDMGNEAPLNFPLNPAYLFDAGGIWWRCYSTSTAYYPYW